MVMNEKKNNLWDFVKFAVIAILIVMPIRFWVAQPFIVSGSSMVPTFKNGDYLIVDELSYQFHAPKKNDVVVFRYPYDTSKFFIKRITGLPGETVNTLSGEITLGENEYFVEGDNAPQSSDSRVWGPLNKNFIVGKTLVRLWPLNKIGISFNK